MPEVWFKVRWPDAVTTRCYSPSTIVRNYFVPGTEYSLLEFVSRSRDAMTAASERVRQTYGYACSSAASQLDEIERTAARYQTIPNAQVTVESFDEG
jgi:uncharacterized repeat protein (TIGR04042 family)